MVVQPAGTVTLLFTDIEGSTRLLQRLGRERYAEALDLHRRLLRGVFESHGGYEVDCEGDAFFVAFSRAEDAVAAAAEAQVALADADWPGGGELRVRMGVHTGEPLAVPPKYVGIDVHRAARIMAAGHGGQVLVSAATVGLLDQATVVVRDLGEHRLKDLSGPQWLYQLGEGEFPALKTLYRTNLPVPATAFLGRERELGEVSGLLRDGVRLLTLTGPGGTGKTRLGLQAVGEAAGEFPDGVWWVPLASVRDPALVLSAVARALEVIERPGRDLAESLIDAVGGKRLLLVVDNVEHLLPEAAAEIARLRDVNGPSVLVTSRERLQLAGERVYAVPPLVEEDGVELFCERAQALGSEIGEVGAVEELCGRLDNLPLAIELAAARTVVLTPSQILERLAQRLDLLQAGRDADPRQQTLRATMEWSHDLLDPVERALFARLAVFVGGCTLEAAEQVCGGDIDTIASLVDKSLLRRSGERFWMLETIREYAAERLEESGEAEVVRERHGVWYLALAERAEPELRAREAGIWLDRLEVEHSNVLAVLERALGRSDADLALRLTGAIWAFWQTRGHWSEGRRWLEAALAIPAVAEPERQVNVLLGAGVLALDQSDPAAAMAHSSALLALARGHGLIRAETMAVLLHARAARLSGDFPRARELFEQGLPFARACGDEWLVRVIFTNLGDLALNMGDFASAVRLIEEGLALDGTHGDRYPQVRITMVQNLAAATLALGDTQRARLLAREGLLAAVDIGMHDGFLYGLLGLAATLVDIDPMLAARLIGGLDAATEQLNTTLDSFEARMYENAVATLRVSLGEPAWTAAHHEGQALPLDDVVAEALALSS